MKAEVRHVHKLSKQEILSSLNQNHEHSKAESQPIEMPIELSHIIQITDYTTMYYVYATMSNIVYATIETHMYTYIKKLNILYLYIIYLTSVSQ